MKNRQLKNYFIYPTFQFSLIAANIVVTSICLFVIQYKMSEVFDKLKMMGEKANLPLTNPYFEFIANSKQMMTTNLNWALAFSLFLTTMSSIYLSHKVVGPIYRLKRYFTELDNNEHDRPINFRKGDFFSELPPLINSVLQKLKEK